LSEEITGTFVWVTAPAGGVLARRASIWICWAASISIRPIVPAGPGLTRRMVRPPTTTVRMIGVRGRVPSVSAARNEAS
jgi:hypothetical protein